MTGRIPTGTVSRLGRKPKVVDWDAMRPHYEAGMRSLASLGEEFGCSPALIVKHAKANEWTRALKSRIEKRVSDKLAARTLGLPDPPMQDPPPSEATRFNRVEIESEIVARIVGSHRAGVSKARGAVIDALAELDDVLRVGGLSNGGLAYLIEQARGDDGLEMCEDDRKALARALRRLASLPERIQMLRGAADALQKLIPLEREAFSVPAAGAVPQSEERAMSDEQLRVQATALASRLGIAYSEPREGSQQAHKEPA